MIITSDKQSELIELLTIPCPARTESELNAIAECMVGITFFEKLRESEDFRYICQHLLIESFQHGDIIFKQDEGADKFYIILEGEVGLYVRRQGLEAYFHHNQVNFEAVQEVALLQSGQAFGELGLLYDVQRTATAVSLASSKSKLAVLEKHTFRKYFSGLQNEQLGAMIEFFQGVWQFRMFPFDKMLHFTTKSTITRCPTRSLIIKQGEKPKGIYFIRSGLVQLVKSLTLHKDRVKLVELDEIGKAGSLCTREALEGTCMPYSILASTSTELILVNLATIEEYFTALDKQNLLDECTQYPEQDTIMELYGGHQEEYKQTQKLKLKFLPRQSPSPQRVLTTKPCPSKSESKLNLIRRILNRVD